MLSKTILTIAIAALLCQSSFSAIAQKKRASMSTMKGSQRISKAVRRVRTLKDATKDTKDTKDTTKKGTKAPKDAPKTKAPKNKVPTAAPNAPTTAPVMAPVMVPADEEQNLESEAPSHSPTAVSKAPVVVLDADTLDPTNCTNDTECGDGWFCMELASLCCEYNTTCRVVSAPGTSGASTFYYGLRATAVYVVVLSIMLW